MSGGSFFEFRERMAGKAAAKPKAAGEAMTVSELTGKIDRVLKAGFPASVIVRGEVSNCRPNAASGHCYFTLKDSAASIPCVMWRSDVERLRFQFGDGMELLATGKVGVFAQQGKYQLYVSTLHPLGQGALELAFQQLKAKLEAEGLFAAGRKKPLPAYPMRVALVTSRATAALQDMLKVLGRYPWLRLFLYHVPVQGEGSAEKIATAIAHLNARRARFPLDVILLARGGGSLEDLWEFNEEILARAIVGSSIPIVTGIGHEVDTSIADLVADHHAHTPTEAAQTIVREWNAVPDALDSAAMRLRRGVRGAMSDARQRLAGIERHEVFRRPMDRVNQIRQLLDDRQRAMLVAVGEKLRRQQRRLGELAGRLEKHRPELLFAQVSRRLEAIQQALAGRMRLRLRGLRDRLQRGVVQLGECHPKHRVKFERQRLSALAVRFSRVIGANLERREAKLDAMALHLQALGPENVLRRGYSITMMKKGGAVVRGVGELKVGDALVTRFADGIAESVVRDSAQLRLFE
jgi:exodeoxyribonuclease VII large subunit